MAPWNSLQAWQTGSEEGPQLALKGAFPSSLSRHPLPNWEPSVLLTTSAPKGAKPEPQVELAGAFRQLLPLSWGEVSFPFPVHGGEPSGFAIQTTQLFCLFVESPIEGKQLCLTGHCRKIEKNSSTPGDVKAIFLPDTRWFRCSMFRSYSDIE